MVVLVVDSPRIPGYIDRAIQRASYYCRRYDTNIVHVLSHLSKYQSIIGTEKLSRTQQARATEYDDCSGKKTQLGPGASISDALSSALSRQPSTLEILTRVLAFSGPFGADL